MLHNINLYVNIFRQIGNLLKSDPLLDLRLVITNNRTKDSRRYNTLNASEVAAIMIGDGQETQYQNRDIVLRPYEGGLQRISKIHSSYVPLHYVLMFPRGKDGWYPNIPMYNQSICIHDEEISKTNSRDKTNMLNKCITTMNYFAYHLQVRHPREALTLH